MKQKIHTEIQKMWNRDPDNIRIGACSHCGGNLARCMQDGCIADPKYYERIKKEAEEHAGKFDEYWQKHLKEEEMRKKKNKPTESAPKPANTTEPDLLSTLGILSIENEQLKKELEELKKKHNDLVGLITNFLNKYPKG